MASPIFIGKTSLSILATAIIVSGITYAATTNITEVKTQPIGSWAIMEANWFQQVNDRLQYRQLECRNVDYVATGRAMCDPGEYAAGVHDDGVGMPGMNGIVCCKP